LQIKVNLFIDLQRLIYSKTKILSFEIKIIFIVFYDNSQIINQIIN
jgi:hypothetical protein